MKMKKIKFMFVAMALIGLTVLMSTTTAPKRTSAMVKAEIDSKIPYKGYIKAAPIIPLAIEYQLLLDQEQAAFEKKQGKKQHGPSASMMEIGWCWGQYCNDCGYKEYDVSIVCWVCSGRCTQCWSTNVECMVGAQWYCDYLGRE